MEMTGRHWLIDWKKKEKRKKLLKKKKVKERKSNIYPTEILKVIRIHDVWDVVSELSKK